MEVRAEVTVSLQFVISSDTFTYNAVVVVKKSNTGINIYNLKGKNSCHTGKGRTAGWRMPIGYFIDQGYMSVMGCNIPEGRKDPFRVSIRLLAVEILCNNLGRLELVGDVTGYQEASFHHNNVIELVP